VDADAHFNPIRKLGSGGFGVVDHVRSKLSLEEYAVRKRMVVVRLPMLTVSRENESIEQECFQKIKKPSESSRMSLLISSGSRTNILSNL
jgi:hypothetical protein